MTRSTQALRTSASPEQTAEYTYEMLVALKEIAILRGQETLAHLLGAAADEARAVMRANRADAAGGQQH